MSKWIPVVVLLGILMWSCYATGQFRERVPRVKRVRERKRK